MWGSAFQLVHVKFRRGLAPESTRDFFCGAILLVIIPGTPQRRGIIALASAPKMFVEGCSIG